MTDQPKSNAAARVGAYLDTRDQLIRLGASLTDQIAECKNAGTPWARLTMTDLRELLAEVQRLTDDRDGLETKLGSALSLASALGQTIRAIPDAIANDAANLAHARAARDRLGAERNQALSDLVGANEQLDHLAERVAELKAERAEARTLARAFRTAHHDDQPDDDLSLLLPDWLTEESAS